jgi:signal transduction histidine kinase
MNKADTKFEILRLLAASGTSGKDLQEPTRAALGQAAALVGLQAAALYLWDAELKPRITVHYAESDETLKRLQKLEDDLFADLRREKELVSAYLSFGGEAPSHSFTLPLRHGGTIFGAVIGLQVGERTIVDEVAFLEALSALLALNYAAAGDAPPTEALRKTLDKEKLAGIVETAVTVNHEINSPLTAILGNVQLLLRNADNLDQDLVKKLKTIEQSAERIQSVTRRLMHISTPRSAEYSGGIRMLDISEDDDEQK